MTDSKRCTCGSKLFAAGYSTHASPSLLWLPTTGGHWMTHPTQSHEVEAVENCAKCALRRSAKRMASIIPGFAVYDAGEEQLILPTRRLTGPTTWRFELVFEDGVTRILRDAYLGGVATVDPDEPEQEIEPGLGAGIADSSLRADLSGLELGEYAVMLRHRYARTVHACGNIKIEEPEN